MWFCTSKKNVVVVILFDFIVDYKFNICYYITMKEVAYG